MKCKKCDYFHVVTKPMMPFETGQVLCTKYDLVTDYLDERKLNNLECIDKTMTDKDKSMILPPKIKDFDIVRYEWRDSISFPYVECDFVKQVMHGEDTWDHNEERRFSFDMCSSEIAEHVTELYRAVETDHGREYKLIWHRPPTDKASPYGVWASIKGARA